MNDHRLGWRNAPPLLLGVLVLDFVFSAAHLVVRLTADAERYYDASSRWDLAASGIWALVALIMCVGLFDLAARRTGAAAVGARVAGLAFMVLWATGFVLSLMTMFDLMPHGEWIWKVEQYYYWLVNAALIAGLAVAAMPRARDLMAMGVGLCVLARLPPFLGSAIFGGLGLGPKGFAALHGTLGLVHTIGMLLLVIAATDGIAVPRRELASRGFGLAASALWLRVVAALASVLLMLMAVTARGESSAGFVKLAMIAGLAVNCLSFLMFGLGALHVARSSFDGVARYAAGAAAATSLWCMGVMLRQLPAYYKVFYAHESSGSFGASAQEHLQALSIALPIVGTLSGAILAGVISGFARARNDGALESSAGASGVGYVLLMLASVGISSFLLEKATSVGTLAGMLLFAAGCALAAQVMLAKVCRSASASIDMEPGLPEARINIPS